MLSLEIWLLLYGDSDEVIPGQVERIIARTKQRYPNRYCFIWVGDRNSLLAISH